MLQDLRYSVRALAKRPSFAAGTILVLGLAVGVNTAVFSLINALLLQPLPVRAPEELTFIVVPIVLIVIVLLACYLPARRAAKVDPLVVLRMS